MIAPDARPSRFHIPHGRLIALSGAAAVGTLVLKFAAYALTGSVGLLSDAVESSANVIAALTAAFALWYAAQPADTSHPYGHEKIEFFASGIEGGLILAAAGTIALTAVGRLQSPVLPSEVGLGLSVAAVATVINYGVGRVLLRAGRERNSIVLEADGQHLLSDVWTSVGVFAGVVGAVWTRQAWLDPLLALLVAGNTARIGLDLLRRSFDGLMDRALSDEEVSRVRAAIETRLGEGMTYHALRTRRAGSRLFADYHLLVPGKQSVTAAHNSEMEIERAIEAVLPGIEVTTHIEPVEEPAAYGDRAIAASEGRVR